MSFNHLLLTLKAALRTVLRDTAHRPAKSRPTRAFRPALEMLEERTVLSTIPWINRGSTLADTDGFNSVFGARANLARGVVDAAIASWERTIVSFNQPFGGNILPLTISMSLVGTGNGAFTVADANPLTGLPTGASIFLDRGSDGIGGGWFLDPTPMESSEFVGPALNAFAGTALASSPAFGSFDLLSTVTHEMGHAAGIYFNPLLRYHALTTNTGIPDTSAIGGGNGTFWVFSGPSVTQLMTSNNGGASGQGFPFSLHAAGPGTDPVFPITFAGKTLFGSSDLMNSSSGPSLRTLIPNSLALMLHDSYGYTVAQPERFGTFYSTFNSTTGNVLIRGGQGTSAPLSDDNIHISRSGADLVVSVDIGNDVPGPGPTDAFVTRIPFATVRSLTINTGDGDDTVAFDFSGGSLLGLGISYDGGSGDDTVIASADADFTLTNSSLFVAGNAFITLRGVNDAALTGGDGANTFTVSDWSGAGNLNGLGGTNLVVAVNDVNFGLTNFGLLRSGLETLSFIGIQQATLTGGPSANSFNLTAWTGTATLNGAGGIDRVESSANADLTLSPTSLTRSIGGTITLQSIEDASLGGGFTNDDFVLLNWPGTALVNGGSGIDTLTIVGSAASDQYSVYSTSVVHLNQSISYFGFESLTIDAVAGPDVVQVFLTAASTPVTLIGGADNDTFYVYADRFITGLPPNLQIGRAINSGLTIDGASGTADTLNVFFTGAGTPAFEIDTVELRANRLNAVEGLSAAGITYSNLDFLNLSLGDGNDTINVISTLASVTTTINAGAGADVVTLGGSTVNFIQGPVTIDGGTSPTGSLDVVILQEIEQPGLTNVGFLGTPPNAGAGTGFLSGFGMGAIVNFTNTEFVAIIEGPSNDFLIFQFASAPQFGFNFAADGGNDGVTFLGTDGNDNIRISRRVDPDGPKVVAQINGQTIVAGYQSGETVTVLAGRGNDTVIIDDSMTTWRAELFGGDGNDRLFGGPLADLLDGGAGNDWLEGRDGDDELIGDRGHDIFVGGAGADRIQAADGATDLVFASVDDLLIGLDPFDLVLRKRR